MVASAVFEGEQWDLIAATMEKVREGGIVKDRPETITFDGESPCPSCGRVICAFCQGRDPDCAAKKIHADGCPYLEASSDDDED